VRFWRPKFRKFPVIFPVSREFGRRKVSARLRAPPRSLHCRETPLAVRSNPRQCVFRDYSQTNRTAETWTARQRGDHCPNYSPKATCALRFQETRTHRSFSKMSCTLLWEASTGCLSEVDPIAHFRDEQSVWIALLNMIEGKVHSQVRYSPNAPDGVRPQNR
jgi:hypothetical protein